MSESTDPHRLARITRSLVDPRSGVGRLIPARLRRGILGPIYRRLPLALRRHILYLRHHGAWGNFRNPRGYAEKMQWRIINDRRPVMRWSADKLAQKEYVRRLIARTPEISYVRIPATYWVGTDVDELHALARDGRLPDRWVFKPNHSCTRVRIYGPTPTEVVAPDWGELRALGRSWARFDEEAMAMGHWAYAHARVALIAEERVGGIERPLEIKVLCFDGRAHSLMAQEEIGTPAWRVAYYRPDFTRIRSGWRLEVGMDADDVTAGFSADLRARIIRAAEIIAAPFDFVRVDFYVHGGEVWLGELTTYSGAGLVAVDREIDLDRGAHWRLPDLRAHDPREGEWNDLLAAPLGR